MIYERVNLAEIVLNKHELAARLSSGPDADVADVDEYILKIKEAAKPAYVAEFVTLRKENNGIYVGDLFTASRGFAKAADGYDSCVLLVVTLGLEVDKLLMRTSVSSAISAFIFNAVADAYVESLCAYARSKLTRDMASAPGFAPGYSDLELSFGEKIVRKIGADKALGIKFTDSGFMIPRKSISTIVCVSAPGGEK